jgi:hypothetical protein
VIVLPEAGAPPLLVLGVVRGVVAEVPPMTAQLERFRPTRLALALGAEEMASYTEQFVRGRSDPFAPLLSTETAEVLALARFGEVEVPHAAFIEGVRWAGRQGVPVEAVDPDEEQYADMFAHHIGYWELVRRTVRERSLTRSPPAADSPDDFVLRWAGRVGKGRASRRFERERTELTCRQVRALQGANERVALIIDRERIPELERQLSPAAGSGRKR